MVPYTVGGELIKRFRKEAEGSGIEVVFIERTGFSLQNQLEQADPYKGPDCERKAWRNISVSLIINTSYNNSTHFCEVWRRRKAP